MRSGSSSSLSSFPFSTKTGNVSFCILSFKDVFRDVSFRSSRASPEASLRDSVGCFVEYEMDVVGDLDTEHTLFIQKSRCPALSGVIIPRPGADLATILHSWLNGALPAEVERAALATQITYLRAAL